MGYTSSPGAIIRIGVDGAETSSRQIEAVGESMNRLTETVRSSMRNLAGAIGIGGGLTQIIQLSDQYTKFTAQLRLASQSASEYARSYQDVKRIAKDSQADLAGTGTLYARIAKGTQELGVSQQRVAAITEVVNLGLKVSGATAAESASAQLQLSQAFASGTLRGEEFNAVNEAAPRLMLALADGIGVPVGALKKMASEGLITSKVMADVLPNALVQLREEAKQVQTISGAFTVLKNNAMEFTAVQANANGTVALLTGGINFLADNLVLLSGAMTTVVASKIGSWMAETTVGAYRSAVASRALVVSSLAAAESQVAATAATSALAAARVIELRAAVAAAEGEVALAITVNGLIPALARETVATEAAAAAKVGYAAATGAAAVTSGVMTGALALLGGPIGAIVAVLGIGATAWAVWGQKGSEAEKKVTQTLAEEIDDYLKGLDRQIAKLKERNELVGKKMVSAVEPASDGEKKRELIMAEINRIAKQADLDIAAKTALLSVWGGMINALDIKAKQAAADLKVNQDAAFATKEAEWLGKNGTAAQKMAHELAELQKEFGRVTPAMEAWVKAKYADKGAAKSINEEVTAYKSLMTTIAEKIAANKLALSGVEKETDAQKMSIKLDAEIASGKNKLSVTSIAAARAQIATVAAQDAQILSTANVKKATEELTEERTSAYMAAVAEARANELLVTTFNMTKLQIEELTLARMEDRLAQRGALELDEREVAQLEKLIAAKKRNVAAVGKLDALDKSSDVTRAKELLDILSAVDDAAKSAATGMAASFGLVGTAIGGLTTSLTAYAREQAAIAAQLAAIRGDKKNSPETVAKAEIAAGRASAQAKIKSYGDMAGAAKGFFKENSIGYKVMEGVEKAYRATEMAMAIESMLTKSGLLTAFTSLFVASKVTETAVEAGAATASVGAASAQTSAWGVTAVVKAIASLPFPANLAAGAATLAAVIGVGAKLAGSIGGGGTGGGKSAAEMQKQQGAGGVFGDSLAQSDSIKRSIELLEGHSGALVPINRSMLAALRAIEASMTGLTNLVVRTPGLTEGSNLGIATGQLNKGQATDFISSIGTTLTKAMFGPGLGDKIASFINNLWGKTTQNIVDSGLQFGGSVRALQEGSGYNQYASVDTTTSSWFGLSKDTSNSVQKQGLNGELSSQFALIFKELESGLKTAAIALGVGADHVTAVLDQLAIDTTSISLKGLSGAGLTDALNAVISKAMDDMSAAVFPELDTFRKVGEGYTQTILRLATDSSLLDSAMASIGDAFSATGISSLAARERLIDLAGGIDKLTEQATAYADSFQSEAERLAPVQKYVAEQMAALGLASVSTREEFKAVVLALDKTTVGGAMVFDSLMRLAPAFAQVHDELVEIAGSATTLSQALKDMKSAQGAYDDAVSSSRSAITTAAGQYLAFVDAVSTAQGSLASARTAIADQYRTAMSAELAAKKTVIDAQSAITAGYIDASSKLAGVQARIAESFSKVSSSLKEFLGTLDSTDIAGASSGKQYSALQSQFAILGAQAKAGDTQAADKLPALATALLKAGKDNSTSAVDFARIVASVRNTISSVVALADQKVAQAAPASAVDELANAQNEQKKWADAVAASGASLSRSTESILAGYNTAVTAQQQASVATAYWANVAAKTGVDLVQNKSEMATLGDSLIKGFFDAKTALEVAQLELVAANTIKAGLDLRQTTALEGFTASIVAVNTTAKIALDAAGVLLATASNKLLEANALATLAQQNARDGMTYWGNVVTTTAAGIAASVAAMATAAAGIAAAMAANTAASTAAATSASANENLVRTWYANNSQFQSAGNAPDAAGINFWLYQLQQASVDVVKQGFAIAAARDAGFDTPLDVSKFASGGAFTNGVVSRPTNFNMGQMGEGGQSEAIMPLTNIGGKLGVRALGTGQQSNAELVAAVSRLTAVVERQQAALDKIEKSARKTADITERVTRGGVVMQTEAVT